MDWVVSALGKSEVTFNVEKKNRAKGTFQGQRGKMRVPPLSFGITPAGKDPIRVGASVCGFILYRRGVSEEDS